jgi:hypothetical protein
MPHWDWRTSAGAPGSRTTSIPTIEGPAPDAIRPTVSDAGEIVSYERHIRPLIRESDRTGMKWAFDLWSYEDVSAHAEKILARVGAGTMPPGRPWPDEWVDLFARWIHGGKLA